MKLAGRRGIVGIMVNKRRAEILALAALVVAAGTQMPTLALPGVTLGLDAPDVQQVQSVRDAGLVAAKLLVTLLD
ncbi:MAG: hypothetical protein V4537_16735 [Pseudomonadota bacterium]